MRMKITTITHKPPTTKKPALNLLKSKQSHPHTIEREYMKALNSVKLDKLFAKPFVKQFSLNDGITTLQINPSNSNEILASTFSNEISLINIKENEIKTLKLNEHVKAVGFYSNLRIFVATQNKVSILDSSSFNETSNDSRKYLLCLKLNTLIKNTINQVEFTFNIRAATFSENNLFLATDEGLVIYREDGSYTNIFNKEVDKVKASKELICTASNDTLYILDAITHTLLKSHCLAPINDISVFNRSVAVACEDSNIYVIRSLSDPQTFLGHTHAATACYLNTNRNLLISASFDKSIRIFDLQTKRSEILYSMRMSELNCVEYSKQGLVFSGSNDGSLRVWKVVNGLVNRKQESDLKYRKKLVEKFKGVREVEVIGRSRHLPRELKGGLKNKFEARKAEERRRRG